jgi:hypothetical protein
MMSANQDFKDLFALFNEENVESAQRKTLSSYDGIEIPIISKQDLILSKKAIGRPQDKLDVDRLEQE